MGWLRMVPLTALPVVAADTDKQADVPTWIRILPPGWVDSEKGRFLVDRQAMTAIIEAFQARRVDLVVDYEHQTMKGTEAPAAGWIKALEARDDGLWAEVEWTDRAREYLARREYRYHSPVLGVRKSDQRAVVLLSVALTNVPAIRGLEPIVNRYDTEEGNQTMELLERLREMLGLPEDATEEQVIEAVRALVAKTQEPQPVANKAVLDLLELPADATEEAVRGKIIALKNPSGYVRVEEFAALQRRLAERERDELVQAALKAGKITPAQKAWAEEYALKDPAGFRSFIEQAPAVVPVHQLADGMPATGARVRDELQLLVNKQLGITDEEWQKYGPKAAG